MIDDALIKELELLAKRPGWHGPTEISGIAQRAIAQLQAEAQLRCSLKEVLIDARTALIEGSQGENPYADIFKRQRLALTLGYIERALSSEISHGQ